MPNRVHPPASCILPPFSTHFTWHCNFFLYFFLFPSLAFPPAAGAAARINWCMGRVDEMKWNWEIFFPKKKDYKKKKKNLLWRHVGCKTPGTGLMKEMMEARRRQHGRRMHFDVGEEPRSGGAVGNICDSQAMFQIDEIKWNSMKEEEDGERASGEIPVCFEGCPPNARHWMRAAAKVVSICPYMCVCVCVCVRILTFYLSLAAAATAMCVSLYVAKGIYIYVYTASERQREREDRTV